MNSQRIGQLLSKLVPLSEHDLEEILQEQRISHQRFGDVALALGLASPEHVWRAWMDQISSPCAEIDVEAAGIDAQVLTRVSARLVHEYGLMPIRIVDDWLVVACVNTLDDVARSEIAKEIGGHVKFVRGFHGQVEQAIRQYYPSTFRKSA